jgi:hypothetical protein
VLEKESPKYTKQSKIKWEMGEDGFVSVFLFAKFLISVKAVTMGSGSF